MKLDLNDDTTYDPFFDGAYGAFAVTSPWDPASWGKEVAQGKAMADAAKKAGVQVRKGQATAHLKLRGTWREVSGGARVQVRKDRQECT